MEWQRDQTGHLYTLEHNGCQALVWRVASSLWAAFISQHTATLAQERFPTLADAQTWCEGLLRSVH